MSQQVPKAPWPVGGPVRFMPGSHDAAGQPLLPTGVSPSLTYEPYYGLKEKPFSLSADPRFLYRSPAHAPAFEELLTGIRRREGLIVLTGEIGTGKTTLIRSVLQHLDRRTFTAFVPDPFVSREDLLKMLLVDFGVVSIADLKRGSLAGASRPDLSYPLYEFLDSLVPLQAFAVLIIDEAQNLPMPLLEEIRILSDLEQREKLLQVVLVGQPELRSHLKRPDMRQVDQRVSVRCELSALGLEDVGEYVRVRLGVASGGESRVEFSESAIAAVFRGSGGVPRVINLICDRALQRGHLARASLIDSSLVEDSIQALGLDVPAPAVGVVPSPPVAETRPPSETAAAKPAPVHPPRSSVSVRGVDHARLSPQILSEFAAESDLTADPARRRVGLWRLAASLVMAALTAAAVTAFWYAYFMTGTVEASAPALPSSPAWTRSGLDTAERATVTVEEVSFSAPGPADGPAPEVAPGDQGFAIQVASFESQARADRLVSELVAAGFRARATELMRGTSGSLFQVRVGEYRTVEEVQGDLTRIRELPGYADAHLIAN